MSTEQVSKKQKQVRSKKEDTPSTKESVASTPVQVQEVSSETSKKVKASKKKVEVAAPSPSPSTSTSTSSSENVVVEETTTPSSLSSDFTTFYTKFQEALNFLSTLKADFKTLEKRYSKEFKHTLKTSSKRKKSANRAPSGFVQPTLISDELASFLGKEKGSKMARTEVTREINQYIRLHNLQDKQNGRCINADNNLYSLLKLTKEDKLTYFNLQKYMSHHFTKNVKPTDASTSQ